MGYQHAIPIKSVCSKVIDEITKYDDNQFCCRNTIMTLNAACNKKIISYFRIKVSMTLNNFNSATKLLLLFG